MSWSSFPIQFNLYYPENMFRFARKGKTPSDTKKSWAKSCTHFLVSSRRNKGFSTNWKRRTSSEKCKNVRPISRPVWTGSKVQLFSTEGHRRHGFSRIFRTFRYLTTPGILVSLCDFFFGVFRRFSVRGRTNCNAPKVWAISRTHMASVCSERRLLPSARNSPNCTT